MTNTHYAGRMYEQFGEAFRKEEEEGEGMGYWILYNPSQLRARVYYLWFIFRPRGNIELVQIKRFKECL